MRSGVLTLGNQLYLATREPQLQILGLFRGFAAYRLLAQHSEAGSAQMMGWHSTAFLRLFLSLYRVRQGVSIKESSQTRLMI